MSPSKRIFLSIQRKREEETSFFRDISHKIPKCKKGDVINPILHRHLSEFDNIDVSFIGQNADQIGFVDQHADDHVTNIYCYKCMDGELVQVIEASIENIVGQLSFDNKILLPEWRCCLMFSKDRLSLQITSLTCGKYFKDFILNNNVLTLDECTRTSGMKMCMTEGRDLMAVVQPYKGPFYSSATIDIIHVAGGNVDSALRLRHSFRKQIQTPSQSILDFQFVCDGRKLILIMDSPSAGKSIICYSVSPFLRLFDTKVVCNLRTKGWHLFRCEEHNDHMITVHDISTQPDVNDKVV